MAIDSLTLVQLSTNNSRIANLVALAMAIPDSVRSEYDFEVELHDGELVFVSDDAFPFAALRVCFEWLYHDDEDEVPVKHAGNQQVFLDASNLQEEQYSKVASLLVDLKEMSMPLIEERMRARKLYSKLSQEYSEEEITLMRKYRF